MSDATQEFLPGHSIVYAMHGKGTVASVETMTLNGKSEKFLRIVMESKAKKADVLIPVGRAREMGLRHPIEAKDLPDFFSQMAEPFDVDALKFNAELEEKKIHSLLSKGKAGLAMAVGRLHQTLRNIPVTPQSLENTYKVLRSQVQVEITQALRKHHKQVRNMINDALGGDYSKPYRKPQVPKWNTEKPATGAEGKAS